MPPVAEAVQVTAVPAVPVVGQLIVTANPAPPIIIVTDAVTVFAFVSVAVTFILKVPAVL